MFGMDIRNITALLCFMVLFITGRGQGNADSLNINSLNTGNLNSFNSNSVRNTSTKLVNSLKNNENRELIARNYYDLAIDLTRAGDLPKAEQYISKAIELESKEKKSKSIGEYFRELARIQEMQQKDIAASLSYEKASELASDSIQKQLNRNDANRVKHKSSPQSELEYLNQNALILSNTNNNYEKTQNYKQIANANIALKKNGPALENFQNALSTADSNSESSISIKSDMAALLAENNDLPNAIALQKEALEQSQSNASIETQVKQLRNLSALYLKADSAEAALHLLQDAYLLALSKGNVKQAKESVVMLANFYKKNNKDEKVTELYEDFIMRLEELIAKDSSLIDKSLFLVNEGKIAELEQQKTLKDELIERKNRYNYVLIGSVLLLAVLLGLIVKAWLSIRKQNKQIALQSLRREMNPHFIFNSLNSVNQFIANNNEREANKYLSSYSGLMRKMMENSNKDHVLLSDEIDQLRKYLELEKLRFSDKFEYEIAVDPGVDAGKVMVPNMIIQPNLENAIWHGLRYKESMGYLKLKFSRVGDRTRATIEDNGIGLEESSKIKTKNQKMHESLGLKNVRERIALLNKLCRSEIDFKINDKPEGGVLVQLEW
jgi:hypothetical protein